MMKNLPLFSTFSYSLGKDNPKIADRKCMLGTNLNPPSGLQITKGK